MLCLSHSDDNLRAHYDLLVPMNSGEAATRGQADRTPLRATAPSFVPAASAPALASPAPARASAAPASPAPASPAPAGPAPAAPANGSSADAPMALRQGTIPAPDVAAANA